MKNTPEDNSERQWVSAEEMNDLNRVTRRNLEIIDEDHIRHMASRLFEFTDFDYDKLKTLSSDQLDFLYDELGIGKISNTKPDFATRLENLKKIKELVAKMDSGEI